LSDLVAFEDLGDLDGNDLRAVLEEVPREQLLEALSGLSPTTRRVLLNNLSTASVDALELELGTFRSVPSESAQAAQRALVDALCRLSRAGQVAFDDPDDMDV
jgi:flagellar motor switch protein FliG